MKQAIYARDVEVATTATKIAEDNRQRIVVVVHNRSSTTTIYIGGPDVTATSKGLRVTALGSLTLDQYDGPLWAVGNGGAVTVSVVEMVEEVVA